ncbi:MAG TPA: Gfo/Idh/MocA family oxidoreductase, partial [Ferruginibacter sp.]|nr:Gfo/Idh/MocA family oxidoreductase [Ferruginibacter sp.]
MKRKAFLKATGITAASVAIGSSTNVFALNNPATTKVKMAIIGTGLRGQSHLDLLLRRDDVDLVAICDISDRMLAMAKVEIDKSGKKMPQVFTGNDYAWEKMLKEKEIDAVIIATPWEWHKSMIIGSLEAGIKYVGTEVMLGITLQDHWDVVKAAEKFNAHVMMLENVCYRRDVMAVL